MATARSALAAGTDLEAISEKAVRLLDDKASLLRPSSFSSKPPTPYGQCAAAAALRTLILALQPQPPNSREHWTQTGAAVSSRPDRPVRSG